jgi:hypothetical protein
MGIIFLQGIVLPKKDAMLDGVEVDIFFVNLLYPNQIAFFDSI